MNTLLLYTKPLPSKRYRCDIQLCTTPAVLHIASYWLTKAYSGTIAKKLILTLLADVQVIDCDHATALMAINSNIDDIEDAL